MSPTQPLRALTGARFFAAAFVVCYHYAKPFYAGMPQPLTNIAETGYTAVGFFFILSGFVMTYSYMTPDGRMRGSVSSFWAARIARIYPAYLAAFIIAAPFNISNSTHLNGGALASAKLLLGGSAVLSLLQAWTPWTAWYWNYPAWSLSVEAFFYLSFPFLVPLAARLSRKQCLTLLPVVWLSALAVPAVFCAGHASLATPVFGGAQLALEVNPLLRLPEFLMGILLGRVFVSGKVLRPQWLVLPGIAAVFALLSFSSSIPRPLIANGLAAPLSAVVILGLAHGKGWLAQFLSLGPLVLLGEASYGIYIFQSPVASLVGIDRATADPLRTVVFITGLLALSVTFFKYFEQPVRPLLRAKLLHLLERRQPVPSIAMLRGNS